VGHAKHIDAYEAQADALKRIVHGLSRDEVLKPLPPGEWSLQQLVMHLYDSDMVVADRMRRIAAMDRPLLMGYDENLFLARLPYGANDLATAAEAFRLNRLLMAQQLRAMPDAAFERVGVHSERGIESLADLVRGYTKHVDHHLEFARGKRAALGKPMG